MDFPGWGYPEDPMGFAIEKKQGAQQRYCFLQHKITKEIVFFFSNGQKQNKLFNKTKKILLNNKSLSYNWTLKSLDAERIYRIAVCFVRLKINQNLESISMYNNNQTWAWLGCSCTSQAS